ncbi:MAG: ABC transporter permease [Anaerolineae bacterium]
MHKQSKKIFLGSKAGRKKGLVGGLLVVAATYLFLYVPIIVLLVFSFNTEGFPSPWKEFTFKWYHELFQSIYLWKAFCNSLIVAIFSTLISICSGVLLIFYAAQGGKVGKSLVLFYGNLIIPETVLAVSLLGFFSLVSIPLGLTTLILAHTVLGLGFVIPITYARFLELDYRLTEVSLVLGATSIQTFFKVTLPLLRPTLSATALLVFIISFDDFILSYFCAGSSSQTLSLYILSMIRSGISPIVNALSALLLFLSSFLVFIFFSLKTRTRIF